SSVARPFDSCHPPNKRARTTVAPPAPSRPIRRLFFGASERGGGGPATVTAVGCAWEPLPVPPRRALGVTERSDGVLPEPEEDEWALRLIGLRSAIGLAVSAAAICVLTLRCT